MQKLEMAFKVIGWAFALLFFGAGGAVMLLNNLSNWLTGIPQVALIFYAAGVVCIVFAMVGGAASLIRNWRTQFIALYDNREILQKERGSLGAEIDKSNTIIWLLCNSGLESLHEDMWNNTTGIQRLILSKPQSPYDKEVITKVTELALNVGIDVVWFSGTVSNNIVIAIDDRTIKYENGLLKMNYRMVNKGWARIEIREPFLVVNNRPSILIKYSESRLAYENIVKCYDQIWRAGEEITRAKINELTSEKKASKELK